MANFTQVRPTQYKEYVPVEPVDLMTQVGVQREQEFQQGVQKVNNYFESIAGLDVARDSDKQYIQQSLNSLKEGITKNLSGDFSDARITNQIGGAAAQIGKDPIVQNALISTAALRSGQNEMDTARKEGKNGIYNDWLFNKKAGEYLSSKDPKSGFNYKYEKYVDVNKNINTIIDGLKPSGYSMDEAYQKDTNGNFLVDQNGNKILNDSVIRNGFKGVKPEQIKAALRAGLTPQDWRQLEIDGMGSYSNMSPEEFVGATNKYYSNIAKQYQSKIDILKNASTNSPEEKTALEQKRISLENELSSLKEEYDGVTASFASGNVESAQAKLHTLNTINNIAAAKSYGEVESHYVGDTPQQMEKWRQDKAQDWKKFTLQYSQSERFHADTMENERLNREAKKKEGEGQAYGNIGQPLSQDEIPALTLDKFTEINNQRKATIDAANAQFIKDNGYDPNSKEGKDWFNAKTYDFEHGSQKLNPAELAHFTNIAPTQKAYDNDLALATSLKEKYMNNPDYKKAADFIPKNAPNMNVQTPLGDKFTYTPTDLVSIPQKIGEFSNAVDHRPAGTSIEQGIEQAKKKLALSSKEAFLLETQYKASTDPSYLYNIPAPTKTILDQINFYHQNVTEQYGKEIGRMKNDLQNELQQKILTTQAVDVNLPTAKAEEKSAVDDLITRIGNYATGYSKGKIGNTDAEDLAALLKDQNKSVSLITLPSTDYQEGINKLVITGTDKVKRVIPLTEQQKRDIFPQGSRFFPSQDEQQFAPIKQQLQRTGGYTTQLGDRPYLDKTNFPSVTNYNVKGNVVKPRGANGYMLKLSITDPTTGLTTEDITYPPGGLADEGGINKTLSNLNDEAIFNLLHNNKTPSKEDMDALQKAAQKPFNK